MKEFLKLFRKDKAPQSSGLTEMHKLVRRKEDTQEIDENDPLLNFADRPYTSAFDFAEFKNIEYLPTGDLSNQVALTEPGLDVSVGEQKEDRVFLNKVLDLTNRETLVALDISPELLLKKPYVQTQLLGHLALKNGFDGILVPTPRVAGGKVLVVLKK